MTYYIFYYHKGDNKHYNTIESDYNTVQANYLNNLDIIVNYITNFQAADRKEAEEIAKEIQYFQGVADNSLYYSEVNELIGALSDLAERYNLTEIFKENGVI